MQYNSAVIDSHLHMHGGYSEIGAFFEGMEQLAGQAGYTGKNVVMVPQWDKEFISQNQIGILYKALYPGKVFAYAGFDYYMPAGKEPADLAEQAKRYVAMGFDGIKMVEMKPTVYKALGGVRLSGERYKSMFSFLEESGVPLLLHVADPETFWDKERCPDFAFENGWFYGDGSFPSKESLYEDTERMLDSHPKLNVSLAHFYFLSDDIGRAGRILDKFPGVRFDLTPGTEMYGNFSKKPGEWREFFIKYEDRILFGTDNGWGSMTPIPEKIKAAVDNVANIRRFLETPNRFSGYGMDLCGIDLPVGTLEKIYYGNYRKMAGKEPKAVDVDKALSYVEDMIGVYEGTDVPFYDRVFPQMKAVRGALKKLDV